MLRGVYAGRSVWEETLTDAAVVAVVIAGTLVGAVIGGVAGFGTATIVLPLLVWAMGIHDAVPVLTVTQVTTNLSRVLFNRKELVLPVAGWFVLGAVPMAVLGGVLFATAPAGALVRVVGVFLLLTVVYRHSPWSKNQTIKLRGFFPLGLVTGFLSAVIGTVGPFSAPFFLAYGLVKGSYVGTEALASVAMHATKLSVYGGYSLLGSRSLAIGLGLGVVTFIGSYIGKKVLDRVPEAVFRYIIEGVLVVAGLQFLIRG